MSFRAHRHTAGPRWHDVGHVAVHLLTPLLMCLGMGLAYLSAFHQPQPNHLRVAVVGTAAETRVLAQTIKDQAGDKLDVTTLPTREAAQAALLDRHLVGAYVPLYGSHELVVATANSETSATVAESVFRTVAAKDGAVLTVTNLSHLAPGDPTGQGIFFLLAMLSIGSYASVAAICAGGAGLPLAIRAVIGALTALLISVIGTVLAGPVFHIVDHRYAALWAMSWLYSAGILAVGIGLHTYLKRWTTLTMMVLFVMLNFTSSGGIFAPDLQIGFYGALHAFWNGAGFVEGVRSLLYFDAEAGYARHLLTLAAWLAAGLCLLAAAGRSERRAAPARTPRHDPAAEEIEEAVGV